MKKAKNVNFEILTSELLSKIKGGSGGGDNGSSIGGGGGDHGQGQNGGNKDN